MAFGLGVDIARTFTGLVGDQGGSTMAFMVKDGFRLYYEDTGGNAPTLLFLLPPAQVIAARAVQEQQRGCVAAGVLVVEAKAVLHHERHRATSLVADETRERAGDVDPRAR